MSSGRWHNTNSECATSGRKRNTKPRQLKCKKANWWHVWSNMQELRDEQAFQNKNVHYDPIILSSAEIACSNKRSPSGTSLLDQENWLFQFTVVVFLETSTTSFYTSPLFIHTIRQSVFTADGWLFYQCKLVFICSRPSGIILSSCQLPFSR